MKKLVTTLLIGTALLTGATAVQAHPRGYGGIHGSVSIAVPLGHNGYALLGTAPYYYPYAGYGYVYGYRHGYRHAYRSPGGSSRRRSARL